MLKLLFAGIACLAASGKYYRHEMLYSDKAFMSMTLEEAHEHKKEGDAAHKDRIEPWLKVVFHDKQVPFLETVTIKSENSICWMPAIPVGKEYSQVLSLADPEFIAALDVLYTKDSEYIQALERALPIYLEKRSEYIKNLISAHLDDKKNIFEFYYSHVMDGGEAQSHTLDNGMTYAFITLGLCPFLKKSPISEKHGYLAELLIQLIKEADTTEELAICAEKIAQEDFNIEASILLHEIGHIKNKDDFYSKIIKKTLPPLTAALGITALALSQQNIHPVLSAGLCTSGALAAVLTMPLAAFQRRGHSCSAVWLNKFIGEYRADSYALKNTNLAQANFLMRSFEKQQEKNDSDTDILDVHPNTSSRIKRIKKQIKKLESSQPCLP